MIRLRPEHEVRTLQRASIEAHAQCSLWIARQKQIASRAARAVLSIQLSAMRQITQEYDDDR